MQLLVIYKAVKYVTIVAVHVRFSSRELKQHKPATFNSRTKM